MNKHFLIFVICFGSSLFSAAQYTDSLIQEQTLDRDFYDPASFHVFQEKDEKKPLTLKSSYQYLLNGGATAHNGTHLAGSAFLQGGLAAESRNFRGNLEYGITAFEPVPFMNDFTDSTEVLSGFGQVNNTNGINWSHRLRGRLNWQLSKHFNVELGNHTNFWGNGYRSMVLGQNTSPYPYLKLTTKVWKIKYTNLFTQLRDIQPGASWADSRKKYVTLHALDFDVTENFSFTVFEAVVWQSSDTLSNRNFELNYLNPIIFYRPVEFSQGSADNVLLGIAARLRVDKNILWYGQLFLDEFLLSEVRSSSGWWANKVGVQLGVKATNILPGLWAYSELNSARPFTYTHGSVLQNYGHRNQSLAHPLGTNFIEWSTGAEWVKKNWLLNLRFNWALYGRDKDGNNYGGDIFRSYAQPFQTFGNEIGQGNTHHSYITQVNASRLISKKLNMKLGLTYNWRHVLNHFWLEDSHTFFISFSSDFLSIRNRRTTHNYPNFLNDF